MIIESIEPKNYRNYDELHMDFNQRTNTLYGDSAQGKTDILETIYVCCTTKSHRGSKDRETIQFEWDESHIKLAIRKNDVPYRIDMHLKKSRAKGVATNGIPIRKASELSGIVNVVLFPPEDLNLIKNGPAERRRPVDLELCQLNKLYVHTLVQYNRAIAQRNELLKESIFRPGYEETLDIWDMQLVQYGKEIIRYRYEPINRLNDMLLEIHKQLSGDKEELYLVYEPNTQIQDFEATLKRSRNQDIKQKTTPVRPHRDDISSIINEIDIRKFGSQGQRRTAALSLRLAEIELVKKLVHDYPVLLPDDVLLEFDSSRQDHLLSGINHIQTMITCIGLDDFVNHRFQIDEIFRVIDRTVINEN